jgi:electron transport complex protein RnfB
MAESRNASDREALAAALDHYTATTIPVHVDLTSEGAVLSLDEAATILREARVVALGPCTCRAEAQRCDGPVETCLAIDDVAERSVETLDGFRFIDADEALAVLRASHEAGLVHLAYRQHDGRIGEFCSCCSCCCWFLTKLKALGAFEALHASAYIAARDVDRCVACGACASRCPFGAWDAHTRGEPPRFDPARCFGCGVCVSGCPASALRLVARVAS